MLGSVVDAHIMLPKLAAFAAVLMITKNAWKRASASNVAAEAPFTANQINVSVYPSVKTGNC